MISLTISRGARLLAGTLLLISSEVAAQGANPQAAAMAQTLLDDAGALMDAGNYADACPKLEQAAILVPEGVGAKMALAECYVGLKKLASAWGQYARAEALALAKKDSRSTEARAEADKLKPRLARISIIVPESIRSVAGLSVTWDGLEQKPAVWGTPMPVDIGKHVLKAEAPGRVTWSSEVVIETDGVSVEEHVPELEIVPVEAPKVAPVAVPIEIEPAPKSAPVQSAKWMKPAGIAALGVGGAGLIAGSVLGGLAISKQNASNAEGECDENHFCNANGVTLREKAFELANGSTAMFFIGGALLGTGAIVVVMDRRNGKESAPKAQANIVLQASAAPGWIGLRGVW